MKPPKTVKAYLKLLLSIARTCRDDLKGIDGLTEEEYNSLAGVRADVQNALSDELEPVLERYGLENEKW